MNSVGPKSSLVSKRVACNEPQLLIADGVNGSWTAARKQFSSSKQKRCWLHKIRNVLDKLSKKHQPGAHPELRKIMNAETESGARAGVRTGPRGSRRTMPGTAAGRCRSNPFRPTRGTTQFLVLAFEPCNDDLFKEELRTSYIRGCEEALWRSSGRFHVQGARISSRSHFKCSAKRTVNRLASPDRPVRRCRHQERIPNAAGSSNRPQASS